MFVQTIFVYAIWCLAALDLVKQGLVRLILSPSGLVTFLILVNHVVLGSLPVLFVLLFLFHLHAAAFYKEQNAEDKKTEPAHVMSPPGARGDSWIKILFMAFSFVVCKCAGVFSIQRLIAFALAILFSTTKHKPSEVSPAEVSDDDADSDITLVDENDPQSPSEISVVSDSNTVPTFQSHLSASQSAPLDTASTHDHSGLRASVSSPMRLAAASFIPALVHEKFDPTPRSPLNPSVAVFVPTTTEKVVASNTTTTVKTEWQPARPLSFQWARGGCPTRITAPPAATPLSTSASVFVPKAPVEPVPVIVKKIIVFRRAPPSFWAPGGSAIAIVAPVGDA
ncbi:hypothetical protein C8F04DRAFT_1231266 [Mycena alexandri]|uniref:Uncharacterized protein n=1 Tax=Mycena alexandri TaxID=1745969 RepID=A0AAD6T4Y9_9AGAR|nr:hypothetical protein C8F04DRAFT_1231266 [Mycena alexandri]